MPDPAHRLAGPRRGPIARFLLGLVALIAVVAAAFVGMMMFLVALGIVVIGTAALALRLWWLRRSVRKSAALRHGEAARPAARDGSGRTVYEGEYTVVRRPGDKR